MALGVVFAADDEERGRREEPEDGRSLRQRENDERTPANTDSRPKT